MVKVIKKIVEWLTSTVEHIEFGEAKHNLCEECGGGGIDSVAGPCIECSGKGYVDKSRKEMWETNFK